MRIKFQTLLILSVVLVFLSGCATVQPWEREHLTRPEMAWTTDSMDSTLEAHIYFSKEASSGGSSSAGGGCGCN